MKYQLLSLTSNGVNAHLLPKVYLYGDWLSEFGFINNALVQALPEDNGIVFNLCNDIIRYNELYERTNAKGGKLIQIYADRQSVALTLSGHFLSNVGLAIGDALIAKYDYGVIRVRKVDPIKLGFDVSPSNIKLITMKSEKSRYGGRFPKIKLSGRWLADIGFTSESITTAKSENGKISFQLQIDGVERYGELVKFARQNGMRIVQVRTASNVPLIIITGSICEKVEFGIEDILVATFSYGNIELRKLNLEKLGF